MAFIVQVRSTSEYFEPVLGSEQPADGEWYPAVFGQMRSLIAPTLSDTQASTFASEELARAALIGIFGSCATPNANEWRIFEQA